MTPVNEERQVRQRERFQEEKRRVWREVRDELFNTLGEDHARQFDRGMDAGDQSVLDLLEDAGLAVVDIRKETLTAMEEAERKLQEGTYGICDECGDEIPEERMQVMPFAQYCVSCQEKLEGPEYPPRHRTM